MQQIFQNSRANVSNRVSRRNKIIFMFFIT